MKKAKLLLTFAGFAALSAAPASATFFTYDAKVSNGIGNVQITIDNVAGTATYKGANIDLVMKDSGLVGFKNSDLTRNRTYKVDSISGTFSRYGRDYTAFWSSRPKHTQFTLGQNYNFLWMYGRDRWGRVYDFDGKGRGVTYTGSSGSSSSSGGSTGGSSSGGTPVPAPGMLGLFALALAGLGAHRSRINFRFKGLKKPALA